MRILLVGDSFDEGLSRELSSLGHELTLASGTAPAVVSQAGRSHPEVIWIGSPPVDASADDLAAQLRQDADLEHATIVKHSESPWNEDGQGVSRIDLYLTRESFLSVLRTL